MNPPSRCGSADRPRKSRGHRHPADQGGERPVPSEAGVHCRVPPHGTSASISRVEPGGSDARRVRTGRAWCPRELPCGARLQPYGNAARSVLTRPIVAGRGWSAVGCVTELAGRLERGRCGDHGLVTEGGTQLLTTEKPAFELHSRAIYRNLTHRSRPRNVLLVREGTGCREAAPTLREDFHWTSWSGPRSGSR